LKSCPSGLRCGPPVPHRRKTLRKLVSEGNPQNFFGNVDDFSFFQVIPSFRNLKFLAGNVITGGDINSVAQHLTKELSTALYAVSNL
jgi:hypothetical protein